MANFSYKASKQGGELVSGEMSAANYDEVYKALNAQGYLPITIEQKMELNLNNYFKKLGDIEIGDIPVSEKVIFSRQLATMLAAGLPITQAIEILLQQTKYSKMRKKLADVYKDVQTGVPLSVSFSKQQLIFNDLQISLIQAGEKSGNLVEIMNQIADDMKKSANLQGKIKGAMIYPIIIFVVIIVVVAVLMIYMIPAVEKLFKDMGDKPLPEITQFLVNISNFLSNPVVLIVGAIVLVAAFLSFKSFYATRSGKSTIDKMILVFPVFGDLVTKMQIYEMARLMQMLFKSGIPIIDALKSTAESLGNYHFRTALENAAVEVSKGVPLAVPLSRSRVIPVIVVKLIATGEQTGKLDHILGEITSFYADQVEEMTSNLTKLMEPFILIVAGLLVAFLAVAIYFPIYQLGTVIN